MAGERLNAPFADLVKRFLADARSQEKLRERTDKALCGEVAFFTKLISGSYEIVDVNEGTYPDLVHFLVQPERIAAIHKLASQPLKSSGVPEKI